MIVIIDYEIDNVTVIRNMLIKLGADAVLIKDFHDIHHASKLFFPDI
jgi:imidazoleglycerol phosphate synthase glutamine amidotransferase subunit HisH